MSILVTGGAGFIGSHFIERVLRETDESVICLDNFNEYYAPSQKRANAASYSDDPRVALVEADFCEAGVCQSLFAEHNVESVMHLGAYAGVRYSVEHPLVYQQVNVCGTMNLLEAVRHHPVKRFVNASSSTVYGAGATAPFDEDAVLGTPMSPYGASKRAAELLCETYHRLHGTPTVSVRLFSVYGPRLRPDLALTIFTGKILRGESLPLFGDGSVRRDFTHVTDVCTGLMAALTADNIVGEAVNLGHDEPIEMRQLIKLLEEATGCEAKIDYQPEKLGDLPLTHANLAKAKRLLGYQPTVAIEEGIRGYVQWFRGQ